MVLSALSGLCFACGMLFYCAHRRRGRAPVWPWSGWGPTPSRRSCWPSPWQPSSWRTRGSRSGVRVHAPPCCVVLRCGCVMGACVSGLFGILCGHDVQRACVWEGGGGALPASWFGWLRRVGLPVSVGESDKDAEVACPPPPHPTLGDTPISCTTFPQPCPPSSTWTLVASPGAPCKCTWSIKRPRSLSGCRRSTPPPPCLALLCPCCCSRVFLSSTLPSRSHPVVL
jgi:hypothetical protein